MTQGASILAAISCADFTISSSLVIAPALKVFQAGVLTPLSFTISLVSILSIAIAAPR